MGTILKVIGGLTIFGWIVMAVGCSMLTHAIGSAGSSGAMRAASDRGAIVRAMQDGEIDAASLPSDLASGSDVTITLRDGTRRTLRNAPEDRLVRAMLAAKAERESGSFTGTSSPYSSYSSRGGTAEHPHFKPGEPMVNPNPGSSYDE